MVVSMLQSKRAAARFEACCIYRFTGRVRDRMAAERVALRADGPARIDTCCR
jgi:hypothetical protein